MLKFFSKIGGIILLAFLLSLGVDHFYRQAYNRDYKPPQNVLPMPEIAEKYDVVRLGNSHADDGLTFERYKNIKPLGLSSLAQTYEYDLAMLKMYTNQIEDNAVIIINVSPISFSQIKLDGKKNVNTQYYDGRLSPFLIPNLHIGDYIQTQFIPFVRSGYLWRTEHAKTTKEKAMSTFAEKFETLNQPSVTPSPAGAPSEDPVAREIIRSEIPTFNVEEIQAILHAEPEPSSDRLIESTSFMVDKWNKTDGFHTKYFETNRKDLQAILDYSVEHGWRPVLVTYPINQVLLDELGPNYLEDYIHSNLRQVNLYNSPYINFAANRQLTENRYLFINSDHLNKKGALITSYLLLQELIDMKYLPKEADGYDYTPLE